jgi:hypothetical protein
MHNAVQIEAAIATRHVLGSSEGAGYSITSTRDSASLPGAVTPPGLVGHCCLLAKST